MRPGAAADTTLTFETTEEVDVHELLCKAIHEQDLDALQQLCDVTTNIGSKEDVDIAYVDEIVQRFGRGYGDWGDPTRLREAVGTWVVYEALRCSIDADRLRRFILEFDTPQNRSVYAGYVEAAGGTD